MRGGSEKTSGRGRQNRRREIHRRKSERKRGSKRRKVGVCHTERRNRGIRRHVFLSENAKNQAGHVSVRSLERKRR